jgi:hypothetical protein
MEEQKNIRRTAKKKVRRNKQTKKEKEERLNSVPTVPVLYLSEKPT